MVKKIEDFNKDELELIDAQKKNLRVKIWEVLFNSDIYQNIAYTNELKFYICILIEIAMEQPLSIEQFCAYEKHLVCEDWGKVYLRATELDTNRKVHLTKPKLGENGERENSKDLKIELSSHLSRILIDFKDLFLYGNLSRYFGYSNGRSSMKKIVQIRLQELIDKYMEYFELSKEDLDSQSIQKLLKLFSTAEDTTRLYPFRWIFRKKKSYKTKVLEEAKNFNTDYLFNKLNRLPILD